MTNRADNLAKAGSPTTAKSQAIEVQLAASAIACLTSSKSETRSAAEALLKTCSKNGTLSWSSIQVGVKKLLPAQQRGIRPILDSFNSNQESVPDKENVSNRSKSGKTSLHGGAKPRSKMLTSPQRSERAARQSSPDHMPVPQKVSSKQEVESSRDESGISSSVPDDNPLKSGTSSTSTKEIRSSSLSRKRDIWPEYPEEPTSAALNSLKKVWSQLLPTSSVEVLFPKKGIQKQEDAVAGCDILSLAIKVARKEESENLIDQLDLIHKWLMCGICSREHTVGMQSLLSLLLELFSFMKEQTYQMTDVEASILLPHLLEKASIAKVRVVEVLEVVFF